MEPMDILKELTPPIIKRVLRPLLRKGASAIQDPDKFVGTDEVSGQLQFELLKREGCNHDSKVLEVGCGNLHAGIFLIRYLARGNYVGIDPNKWLRQGAMKNPVVRQLVREKRARFLSVDDFDAGKMGVKFDYVLSHSVLSHCSVYQLKIFLRNVSRVLTPEGRILASIRLAEGNENGSTGTPDRQDSKHETWQYPGVTWFKFSTVAKMADDVGLTAVHVPQYTELYTRTRPNECHDWLIFSRV